MKTFTHLWLDDKGLKAFNAPEPINRLLAAEYEQELQQALDEGVYFKDDGRWDIISMQDYIIRKHGGIEKHKVYDVPDGYEVRVENVEEFINTQTESGKHTVEYAILVPKDKGASDDYPVIPHPHHEAKTVATFVKQPSTIEEAGLNYFKQMRQNRRQSDFDKNATEKQKSFLYKEHDRVMLPIFIAGAKSQAAKEYWYEQFKREQQ